MFFMYLILFNLKIKTTLHYSSLLFTTLHYSSLLFYYSSITNKKEMSYWKYIFFNYFQIKNFQYTYCTRSLFSVKLTIIYYRILVLKFLFLFFRLFIFLQNFFLFFFKTFYFSSKLLLFFFKTSFYFQYTIMRSIFFQKPTLFLTMFYIMKTFSN